jgi:hypothetical protein
VDHRVAETISLISHDLLATAGVPFHFSEEPRVSDDNPDYAYLEFWIGGSGRGLQIWPEGSLTEQPCDLDKISSCAAKVSVQPSQTAQNWRS